MRDLIQEDIDYLDSLAEEYNCTLYFPPVKGRTCPFFVASEIIRLNAFVMALYDSGFSFVSEDEDYIAILGA